jgi:hypothetical protein
MPNEIVIVLYWFSYTYRLEDWISDLRSSIFMNHIAIFGYLKYSIPNSGIHFNNRSRRAVRLSITAAKNLRFANQNNTMFYPDRRATMAG